MKSLIINMVAAAGLLLAANAMAVDMPPEGKAKCSACHSIEKKVVGPAWRDISKKYKGNPEGVNMIVMHVISGGDFGWKTGTKMPARGLGANDADIQKLAAFIISLED